MKGILKKSLSFVAKKVGLGSAADAVRSAIDIVSNAIGNDPELQKELREFELAELKTLAEESDGIRGLWKEEIKSGSAFVRNARPWGLYMGYTLIFIDLGILSIANAISAAFGGLDIPFNILPREFYALFGTMFTGSLIYRGVDKRRITNG